MKKIKIFLVKIIDMWEEAMKELDNDLIIRYKKQL